MWSMLGARSVDIFAWESFGEEWVNDAKQLKLDAKVHTAAYGRLPDLSLARKDADTIFTQNGTTSGVRVPSFDWIAGDREGITINDATSAVFAQPIDWAKCDVTTFSWQKVLGGEAAHGMLVLSPRAAQRLETYTPAWPLPKVFRLASGGKLMKAIFEGETINTPSMLCVEDYLDTLAWGESVGGLKGLIGRADANAKVLWDWIERTPWIANLAADPATRSNTSVCIKITDPAVANASAEVQANFAKDFAALLEKEGAAMDCGAYRDAPPGLRIWTGSTIEKADVEALLPWLEWAFHETKAKLNKS
jgi:phosphoserine aminotransferase